MNPLRRLWQGVAVRIVRAVQTHGPHEVEVLGDRYTVTAEVFNPKFFRTSEFLARHLEIRPGDDVLEIGTGSGILAATAARTARSVLAVDINPEAVRCARANIERLGLGAVATVRQGNLFEGLPAGAAFDVIVFAPPYFEGATREPLDHALFDPGKALIRSFLEQARSRLKPGGSVRMVYTTAAEPERVLGLAAAGGWTCTVVARRRGLFETYLIWRLTPAPARP